MDEDEKPETEADDLTPDEREIEDETGTSGEEAHRIGEFDDLRDRLERIENTLGTITETLEAMRTTYDQHTHRENDAGGQTNVPTQKML